MDTCHTSDKGKGRGSPALPNSPAPRPQSSKKGSSTTPSQQQKKHKVSLYYTKYKSSSSTTTAGAVTVDEEHEDLTPDLPLTPDPDVCNNNEPAFISKLDKKTSTDFKEDLQSTIEDRVPAVVMFPMEMPAGFPDGVTLIPGTRPGLLVCSPVEKSCTVHYAEKMEKRDSSELEVRTQKQKILCLGFLWKGNTTGFNLFFSHSKLRDDDKGQRKTAQSPESGTAPGNKGKRSRRKAENVSRYYTHLVVVTMLISFDISTLAFSNGL